MLEEFVEGGSYASQEKGHRCEETRCALATKLGYLKHEWPNLKSVAIMVNMRQLDHRKEAFSRIRQACLNLL